MKTTKVSFDNRALLTSDKKSTMNQHLKDNLQNTSKEPLNLREPSKIDC